MRQKADLCDSDFITKNVPGGCASYGFQIQGVPGTVNMISAQLAKRVGAEHRVVVTGPCAQG